ncbi:MAG: SRPBCC domain-containing protein [Candidatus Woesearchaeota archaeon]|nr:SRPBCC domain-containing protein [Candidatus Woesearchaeota archaeon]
MKKSTMEREFNASIEKVWEAFTTPKMLSKWWSPEGMTSSYISVDLREGGFFRYCMKSDQVEVFGLGEYETITKPTILSYHDTFSDAKGTPVPPSYYGMPGDKIEKMLFIFSFSAKGDKTHMRLSWENSIDEKMTADMTKGWNSMFDKLDSVL